MSFGVLCEQIGNSKVLGVLNTYEVSQLEWPP
jgi:hypothetical protein